MFEFKPFSAKQRRVMDWWLDGSSARNCNGIIADGAIRSGKTLSMSLSYIMWAMYTFDGKNFGICGKTQGSLRRNVLVPLKTMLISRGYTVEENRGLTRKYMECDLLIIDDLGTEMTTQFTISALYHVINSRMLENRSTVISTNLPPEAIEGRYSPQIASRIIGAFRLIKFAGEDIRRR